MLVQFSSNEETRTYLDCKNPDICFETFLRLYENFMLNKTGILTDQQKVEENPEGDKTINYKLEDLLKFID